MKAAEIPAAQANVKSLTHALAAPFDPAAVKFKPAVVSGNRALALAYVDARAIQDRLDAVLGVEGWQDEYECLADGSVICRLRLRLGEDWITKMDVGGPSEQPDGGDRRKAAFSDALKRAAVKFGVGRYLYRLPSQWVDYDPQKRQFVRPPTIPRSAPRTALHTLPANGVELKRRLQNYEAQLAKPGLCRPGELIQHILQAGVKAGHGADMSTWNGAAIVLAVEETKAFEAQARQRAKGREQVA